MDQTGQGHRASHVSAAAVIVLVVAASATIGFGVAPGGGEQPDRALALGATPMEVTPSATDGPTGPERLLFERATTTPTTEPSSTPGPTATATSGSTTGVSAAALIQAGGDSYSAATVKAWARQAGWPESTLDEVVAVAWCESRHRPAASNGVAYGLMQVVPLWFSYAGIPFAQWTDPVANLRVAYTAYTYDVNRGYERWTQWQCKPWMVAPGPADDSPAGVEDGVHALPTPESSPTVTPSAEATATEHPSPTPTPPHTPSPSPTGTQTDTPEPSLTAEPTP